MADVAEKGLQWFFSVFPGTEVIQSGKKEKPEGTSRPGFETKFPIKFKIVAKIQILQPLFENDFKLVPPP